MSHVILARRRPVASTSADVPSVHAWHLPVVDQGVVAALCGQIADPSDLDRVEKFAGAPCPACLLASVAAASHIEAPADERQFDEPAPVIEVDGAPDEPAGHGRSYGVALRGEQVVHLVEPDAIRGRLDGRGVVHTVCACLAWGPLTDAPAGWPICAECAEIVGGGRT